MSYYKLLNMKDFIGVATTQDLRKFQTKNNIFLSCDIESAQYIQCGDKLYRDNWMCAEPDILINRDIVDVVEIDKKEYDALYNAIETNNINIVLDENDTKISNESIKEDSSSELEYVIKSKINEMSLCCKDAIYSGFSIKLSDGKDYHFSLTMQDQMNISNALLLIYNGEINIPYHADDDFFKYYSKEDMIHIINEANKHKLYHLSYFNSLKKYIESISSINQVSEIYYGSDIPTNYRSIILSELS